jgi:hypothetical protein
MLVYGYAPNVTLTQPVVRGLVRSYFREWRELLLYNKERPASRQDKRTNWTHFRMNPG